MPRDEATTRTRLLDETKDKRLHQGSYVLDLAYDENRTMWQIDARHFGGEARLINSSHAPNCVCETWWVGAIPHAVIRTLEFMLAGREILFNYNSVNSAEECLCGAE
eukprot:1869734-Rhodomonas_salina.1